MSFFTPWYTRLAIETTIFLVPAYALVTYPNFIFKLFERKLYEKRRYNYDNPELRLDLEKGSIEEA